MTLTSIRLLDSKAVAKVIYSDSPLLTTQAIKNRILRLRKQHQLPMQKIGNRYLISIDNLNRWIAEKNL
jgi:hypothetical protein|tara:strand:- start:1139 stop:1345 length:207 start_codon:yes stop_codon:yes gene_type:complete